MATLIHNHEGSDVFDESILKHLFKIGDNQFWSTARLKTKSDAVRLRKFLLDLHHEHHNKSS